jgi:hypothetical protein
MNPDNRKNKAEWADLCQPIEAPAATVTETSLFELIGAIDEVLEEEAMPGRDKIIAEVLSHLLKTGRMKFKDRLRNFKVEIGVKKKGPRGRR